MLPAFALAALAAAAQPAVEHLKVDPDAGNSTFTAVFDAKLGERITANSSSVGCELEYDAKELTASGVCSVPLTSIRVDNEPTKTEHFQQWATNKKSEPGECAIEARLDRVRIGALQPEQPVSFKAEIPFTVCGRPRGDGGRESISGTAVLFPPGSYGTSKTIRVRATVARFDREAYRIGPQFTEGWLARVQSLAKVVASEGTVEITLFAKAGPPAGVAQQR